jgi:uncharacterized protein (DUF433 family)
MAQPGMRLTTLLSVHPLMIGLCRHLRPGGQRAAAARTIETMTAPVIVIDPEVMNGTPCFRGTRVPFKNLIDYIEGGHSPSEFLLQFPAVTHDMAIQALEEAKNSLFARIA